MEKKILAFSAIAALLCVACAKEQPTAETQTVTISLSANLPTETKTSFGDKVGEAYPSVWNGTENVAFSLNEANVVEVKPLSSGSSTSFNVTFAADDKTSGTIYAVSPYNSDRSGGFSGINTKYDDFYVNIPASQKPLKNSCDERTHMVAGSVSYTDGLPASAGIEFKHIVAYGKMTLKNVTEELTSVSVTFPESLFGTFYYYYADNGDNEAGSVAASKTVSQTLTVDMSAVENNVIWFGCAPAAMKSGDMIVNAVGKSGAKYSKTVTLSGEKSLSFVQGKVAPFSVDMTVAPVIDADDVANLSADEHSLEQIAVNVINPVVGASLSAEVDGTVVTDCKLIEATWYYSVSANTGEERTGWIKFSYKSGENVLAEKTVNVKQLAAGASLEKYYVKVTSADDLTDGQYLIVYESGKVAFDGSLKNLDSTPNTVAVIITDSKIQSSESIDKSAFSLSVENGIFKGSTGISFGKTANSNGLDCKSGTEYTNTISVDTDFNATILSSGGAYLRFNDNSGQKKFRYFKSASYKNQKAIQLYKLEN